MATVTFRFRNGIGPDFDVVMTHAGTTGTAPVGSGNNVNTTPITNILTRDPNNGNAIIGPPAGWTPVFDSATARVVQKFQYNTSGLLVGVDSVSRPGFTLCEYVTWRTENNSTVHPTTGYSFDIWYPDATTAQTVLTGIFNSTYTWAQWRDVGQLNLHPNYWSVVYDYNNQYAIGWKKGGDLTVLLA